MGKQIKQLTQAEKRRIITEQLRIAGQLSNRSLAAIIGCSPTTIGAARRELQANNEQFGQQNIDSWTKHPYFLKNKAKLLDGHLSEKSLIALRNIDVLDKMAEIGSLSPRYAQRLLHKERKAANKNPSVTVSQSDIKIFQGDVRTGLPEIADSSVQLCFVDIPYDKKSIIELTPHIAMTASRILSEGSSLLLLVGGSHLDVVLEKLTKTNKTLRFQWDIAYVCPRGTPLIQGRRVTTAVKHIIWMVKGKYSGPIQHDIIFAPPDDADKELYYHGQSAEGIKSILTKWSSEGDCICDFMCGGGSTAVAGLELGGRKLILCDISKEAVAITRKRVAEMFRV